MAETGAVEFDEFADNALLAQHLCAGEHQVGGGCAFGQLAGELEADDVGREHVDGLAQHHRFGFDAAHAPADDAKAVDHGGVTVGADEAVGIGDKVAVELLGLHHLAQIFEIHLMNNACGGWNHAEVVKRFAAPFQKFVALADCVRIRARHCRTGRISSRTGRSARSGR